MMAKTTRQGIFDAAREAISALNIAARSTKALLVFFAFAFAWSWCLGVFGHSVIEQAPVMGTILSAIAGFGPSLAGVAVVTLFSEIGGFRSWLTKVLNWRVGWRWYLVAFCLPPATMLLALAIHYALGGAVPAPSAMRHIPLAIANFGLVLLVGGPLGEEFGWRGYAMPTLSSRWGWRGASLIIGAIWGLWHLPLFFIADTAQSAMLLPMFMVNILAGSVVFGWLFERTHGSVLPALVLHMSLNAWTGILGIVPTPETGRPYMLATGILVLIALALLLINAVNDPTGDTTDTVHGAPA
jgi:uncharacterized protein